MWTLDTAVPPLHQAPQPPQGIPLTNRVAGYADILLSQGWSDFNALWGFDPRLVASRAKFGDGTVGDDRESRYEGC